jgi:hypothetical protein
MQNCDNERLAYFGIMSAKSFWTDRMTGINPADLNMFARLLILVKTNN